MYRVGVPTTQRRPHEKEAEPDNHAAPGCRELPAPRALIRATLRARATENAHVYLGSALRQPVPHPSNAILRGVFRGADDHQNPIESAAKPNEALQRTGHHLAGAQSGVLHFVPCRPLTAGVGPPRYAGEEGTVRAYNSIYLSRTFRRGKERDLAAVEAA